jgi:hypothetical protein
MQGNRKKVLSILGLTILIFLAATIVWANLGLNPGVLTERPAPATEPWRLGQPVTYKNLTIFPVVDDQDADTSGFVPLDRALASGAAVVTENGEYLHRTRDGGGAPNSGSAEVNQLVLVNRGKRPLILLAGEVVAGGKQDRIIGKDRIVPVGAPPLPLEVFCVEHGRWTGDSGKFSAAEMMVDPSVRERAAVERDQARVWAAVRGDRQAGGTASEPRGSLAGVSAAVTREPLPPISDRAVENVILSSAPTESYRKIYNSSPIGTSVEEFAEEIERRFKRATGGSKGEYVVGVVVGYGDEVGWSDIFASSELFDVYWPKLLRSYVVEALTRAAGGHGTVSLEDARDFLRPTTGRVVEESEPGVYSWREQSEGRIVDIELRALEPKAITLHRLRVLRTN